MALTRNRLIGNLANATDSAASSSFLAKGATEADYQSIAYSDVTSKPTILDSAGITSIIDSSYVQARQGSVVAGLDSAGITSLVDSNYVVARAANSGSGYGRYNYTATAGQTVFQDSDNSGALLSYTSGGIMVFYNGVMLKNTSDWEGTDGSSVTLVEAADSGANVSIHKWTVAAPAPAGLVFAGDRAVIAYGRSPNTSTTVNNIDYYDITTPGNATDFGDLSETRYETAGVSDTTYGVFAGGYNTQTVIDYVTIASTGNATDFGDLTRGNSQISEGASNGTLGLFYYTDGSDVTQVAHFEYITIATPGNATQFASGTPLNKYHSRRMITSDGTIGVFAGGESTNSGTVRNDIEYLTIATSGDGTDFGDLTATRYKGASCSDLTYGLFGGGYDGTTTNAIDYITIASPANATDFGDLVAARQSHAGVSNETYGTFAGGAVTLTPFDAIYYVTITSPGNATDFGDLTAIARDLGGTSGNAS